MMVELDTMFKQVCEEGKGQEVEAEEQRNCGHFVPQARQRLGRHGWPC